jgi:tetratricopeptide (TPR) repeat protein
MVLLLLLLGSFQAFSASPEFARLNALIDGGQPRRAGPTLRKMLAENPSNHEARATFGRALTVMGRYDEALVHLRAVRPTTAWVGKIAAAEASCHMHFGRLSEAQVAYEEALWMNPQLISAQHALAILQMKQGDWFEAAGSIESIEAQGGWPFRAGVLRVELARSKGEDPWFSYLELERAMGEKPGKTARQQLAVLRGQIWLDANGLERSEKAFVEAITLVPFHEGSILGRAETLRRLGLPQEAQMVAGRKVLKHSPLIHPIRARILVDLGDFSGAQEELEKSNFPHHLEAIASQWYLERAKGQSTKAVEQAWNQARSRRKLKLSHLIPLESP